ncbi:MAG: tetrahydromethanopterin S-methyltransferase subunit A, partial [bacterium]
MLKVQPTSTYPPEKGCYLRGNEYSPVAVVVLLNAPYGTMPPEVSSIPKEIENLVKVAIETGAALSGTLQTENIGIEKIVCNIVANPNIRYLIVCGNEVEGHNTGTAIKALMEKGIDERRTIIGSQAMTPYLFNIPLEAIFRFREQLTLIDLIGETDPEVIMKGIWSCYQENPTPFKEYKLYDPGAYSDSAISCSLTWKVKHPEEIEDWEI